ncbi:MAG: Holliday junction resolvase RuvX [Candidatus Nomurabacteria bacterium]|nr:MAG: Holliday junction resolvase RuvX [Candidatus Nomurabacteria bacterium]HRV76213.1 Holliday junction resolvase RuvX [Candidatus Saccharimonadales bacterium]
MKIISLDFGEKYIGVAYADTDSVLIAQPLEIISNKSDGKEIETIDNICKKKRAEAIVLGYPRNLSGNATLQTREVEVFGDKLKSTIQIPLIYQDETLSSVLVRDELSEDKKGKKKRIDDQAAALILQDYLEQEFRK